MAKEYIERTELIENLNRFAPEHYNALINQLITNQPTADVVEVKRGYWKGKPIAGYSDIRCSVCNTRFVQETGTWAYCPECGAKMDGGKT